MKKIIFGIIILMSFISCKNEKYQKSNFTIFFDKKMEGFYFYKNLYKDKDTISRDMLLNYYDDMYYLEHLTNINLRFVEIESNIWYNNSEDITKDISDLKLWFSKNKDKMTIEKADSLVKQSYIDN